MIPAGVADRFQKYVDSRDTHGCWLWTGARQSNGYGVIGTHRQTWRAHRVAWELAKGDIPAGAHVCHHCDNRRCVNPAHLFVGTSLDNMLDKARKGRTNRTRLTPDDVRAIRAKVGAGEPLASVAKAFAVSVTTTSDIARRKIWAHVDGDGTRAKPSKRRSQQ